MAQVPPWALRAIADRSERLLADAPRSAREQFIPLRHQTLFEKLVLRAELSPADRRYFRCLVDHARWCVASELHPIAQRLTAAYAPFDPDDDTCSVEDFSSDELRLLRRELFGDVLELLRRANYRRLSRAELEQSLEVATEWGLRLNIDFSVFDRLEVFARGHVYGTQFRRLWYAPFRKKAVSVPIYQRLVILFSLRHKKGLNADVDTTAIYLKLFKNIPTADVDMLLPSSRIRLTLLDHGKIFLPTISGVIVTIVKIIKGAIFAALSGSLWGLIGFFVFVFGTIGYGLRSFFGYLHTKDKYQLHLTRNLYYQNLDNNAGVFYRLLDDAKEQELREILLAYFVLWKLAPEGGFTAEELDQEVERLIQEWLHLDIDFDVLDALDKLVRFGLARKHLDEKYTVLLPELPSSGYALQQPSTSNGPQGGTS